MENYLGNEHKYWVYLINCCHWKGMRVAEIYQRLSIGYDALRRIQKGQPFGNDLFSKLLRLAGHDQNLIEKDVYWIEDRLSEFAVLEKQLKSREISLLELVQSRAKNMNVRKRDLPYPFYAKPETYSRNNFKITHYNWVKTCNRFNLEPIETLQKNIDESSSTNKP